MRGIFIDLDGTLLNDSNEISNEDLNYIKSIKEDNKIYLITGMSFDSAKIYYDQLGLDTALITSQGMRITDSKKHLDDKKFIIDKNITKLVENQKTIVVDSEHHIYIKGEIGITIHSAKKFTSNIEDIKNILTIYVEDNFDHGLNVDEYKWDIGPKTIRVLRPKGINKEYAIRKLIKLDNLTSTIMIGNGRADIGSIKLADIGIAMINSHISVHDTADKISIKDNNHSGVSDILKKII